MTRLFAGILLTALLSFASAFAADLRLGMIGMDTGHSIAFTEILNNPKAKDHVPGAKVVAAFKVSSPDIESSWSRVDVHAEKLAKQYGVKFYDSIEEMVRHVDAVLMEDNDARRHAAQAKIVLKAGKRLYIEKPLTLSAREAAELFAFAKKHGGGLYSGSGSRFGDELQAVRAGKIGRVTWAEMYHNAPMEPTNPELFWYGVHGVEALFTVLGTGIETVTRKSSDKGAIVTEGQWSGGRVGIFREGRDRSKGKAVGDKGEATGIGDFPGYPRLVQNIIKFFQTGVSPVPDQETVEIIAFMEADVLSKARGGQPVKISEILPPSARAAASR